MARVLFQVSCVRLSSEKPYPACLRNLSLKEDPGQAQFEISGEGELPDLFYPIGKSDWHSVVYPEVSFRHSSVHRSSFPVLFVFLSSSGRSLSFHLSVLRISWIVKSYLHRMQSSLTVEFYPMYLPPKRQSFSSVRKRLTLSSWNKNCIFLLQKVRNG